MKKIIFLDIDGVLNCSTTTNSILGDDGVRYDGIDSYKMLMFKQIIDATDSYIVVSSSWRKYEDFLEHLENKLGEYNNRIIGYTPNLGALHDRYDEIENWLTANEKPINYIILDDIDYKMKETFGDHFFHTDYKIGLTEEIKNKCIEFLNKEVIK